MAWRRSQVVVCVHPGYDSLSLECTPNMPKFGGRYTIDTIQPIPDDIPNLKNSVGLRFIELVNPICPCNRGEPMFFWSEHFEPLVEDEQDISALVDAAAKVTLPKREDAKPVGSVSATIAHGGAVLRTLREQRAVLMDDQPGEAVMTPGQVAVMNTAINEAADDILREFVRTFIIPLVAKRLGL